MIFLVRHGETLWNTEHRRQGRGDSPLTDHGIAQSKAVANALKDYLGDSKQPISLVTSPAGRSQRTALMIADALGLNHDGIREVPQLAEMDFGDWQGLTDAEIAQRFPEQWRDRQLNRWFFQYPQGESYPLLCSRVAQWMESAEDEPGIVIAVTHQWTSRVIRGQYLRLPKEEMFDLTHEHGLIVKLENGQEEIIEVRDGA